jgi:ADP-ribosyl-[dinitrogen reductase] hydrolase
LSAPTHWYYGGFSQVQRDYGRKGITDYTKPKVELAGSIMNKSNVNGGGRGSFGKDHTTGKSIIGDIINHGKLEYWSPSKSTHYHATLQKGENTLEAQLARVLMKSIVANDGNFDQDHFRQSYIDFMTTKGSHNDTYASTCHRMFFANWFFDKKDPKECPDNDHHNVDSIDGLVLPSITALAYAGRHSRADNSAEAQTAAAQTAAATRQSVVLENISSTWAWHVLGPAVTAATSEEVQDHWNTAAQLFGMRRNPSPDQRDELRCVYSCLHEHALCC